MGPMTKQEPSLAPHFWNAPYLVGFVHGKAWGLKTSVRQVLTLAGENRWFQLQWTELEMSLICRARSTKLIFLNIRTIPKIESFFLSQIGCQSRFPIMFTCIIITGTKTIIIYFLEPELGFLILGYEKFAQVVVFFITDPEMMGFTKCDV